MERIVALSAFRQLGYTQTQAEQLEAAAVNLAEASGVTLDHAEVIIKHVAEGFGPKPHRPSWDLRRSGRDW